MPTSNGQLGRYDIRQGAIDKTKIRDGAVVTAKIPDLAITFPDKLDDPIWSTTFGDLLFHNATVTTTPTSFGTLLVDIPAWVDGISVLAIGYFQISNSSGSSVAMQAGVEIEGEVQGGNQDNVGNNETGTLVVSRQSNLVGVAGSSVGIDMEVSVSSGTNSSNHASLRGIVVGTRG